MKHGGRRTLWISLLLAGALSIPGELSIRANGDLETVVQEEDVLDEKNLSDNMGDGFGISENRTEVLDRGSEEADELQEISSENGMREQSIISDNVQFSDVKEDKDVDLENDVLDVKLRKEMFDVVLPVEISCDMVLLGEERIKGVIRSKQFYIENRGYEDVCISLQGVCSGKEDEEYVIQDVSVKDDIEQGKKNVWIYLRWEDENGEEIERPGIVMGDVSTPGEGEIILEAPKRDGKGNIQGENAQSKVYFSFFGDINSDTGHIWENDELQLNLKWMMEEVTSDNTTDLANPPEQTEDLTKPDKISDNFAALDEQEGVSFDTEAIEESQNKLEDTNIPKEIEAISNNSNVVRGTETISDNLADKRTKEKSDD